MGLEVVFYFHGLDYGQEKVDDKGREKDLPYFFKFNRMSQVTNAALDQYDQGEPEAAIQTFRQLGKYLWVFFCYIQLTLV